MHFSDANRDTNPLKIKDITDVQAVYAPINRAWKTAMHDHGHAKGLQVSTLQDFDVAQKQADVNAKAVVKAQLEIDMLKTLYHQSIPIPDMFGQEHFRYWFYNLRDEVTHIKQLEAAGFEVHPPTAEQRALAGVSFFIEKNGKYFPVIFEKSTKPLHQNETIVGVYDTNEHIRSIRKFSEEAAVRMRHCLAAITSPLVMFIFGVDLTVKVPTATAISERNLKALMHTLDRL